MIKNCVIITKEGKPTELLEIKTFKDSESYLEFKKVCDTNKVLYDNKKEEENKALQNHIAFLEQEIKRINKELAYNRGEISEEEYKGE